MKKVTAKIITISSQLLVVVLSLLLLFSGNTSDNKSVAIGNNNLNKMADKTATLFNKIEEEIDSNVIVDLTASNELEEAVNEVVIEGEKEDQEVVEETSLKDLNDFSDKVVIETFTGNLTGYGPDCYGCSGNTSTGYNLNNSIYYEDPEYGTVRVLAADKYFPFYSIIRVSNVLGMDDFLGIVLDRGGNVGFDRGTLFDLAFESEKSPNIIGLTQNVVFEVLRSGK